MAKDHSFDITFEVSLMEVDNALNQTVKEIQNRYDFKGVETKLERKDKELLLETGDDMKIAAVKEMFRQVGLLQTDEYGIAVRGLIIRHLVLPGGISGTEEIMKFIAEELSRDVAISLMDQYFPTYRANAFPEIDRKITAAEYQAAMDVMDRYGLHEGWVQEHV